MKVTEVRTEAEFKSLSSVWDPLLQESVSATVFTSWEWMMAWWRAYGREQDLRIAIVQDQDNVLRGIAPMRQEVVTQYGQSALTLRFIGDGSCDSDYLDFVIARGWEEQVMSALTDHWTPEIKRGAVLVCNAMTEKSPSLAALRKLGTSPGQMFTEVESRCGTVRLPDNWEAFLGTLKPRFRTKIRSSLRNLESRPGIRFGFCKTLDETERLLPALFDLHARRWTADGKPGVFGSRQKRTFYYELTRLLLDRGCLRFCFLEWQGRILACQYGFNRGPVYFHLQEGYEPASEHWSLGVALRAWCIRELLKEGVREYDFLEGIGRHKMDWGADPKLCSSIQVASRTWKNLVFCRGAKWNERSKECVKALIPKRILAMRNAGPRGGEARVLRHTAASVYFRLGLPALMRGVREKYSVSLSRTGIVPGIRCLRRTQPAGRILYYHRVNDDNDPFFPAMSVRVFEQQMGFLAQHYNVVSLADLIQGIQSAEPREFLAITFDDGYLDNYENAFPILRKYGLPATVFLTTGSIDSQRPLWFEELALTLKTTPRDILDLEIDVPRRLHLRTEQERLAANDVLYALLRSMPDVERREWLARVLGQCGGSAGERNRRMLTWDRVRQMKQHGVQFGGHTVTHPFVSRLTEEQATWEVSECKQRIEQELQSPVDHFAYPSGREQDIGACSRELLVKAGYRAALTTLWGTNSPSTDLMELRRGQPWEPRLDMFACKFDWYQLSRS